MSREIENATAEQDDMEEGDLERDIAREVEEAFASVPYPGDDRLLAYPDYRYADEVLECFRGKHWRELSRSMPPDRDFSLFVLTPEAFRFYLPAYLVMAMLDESGIGLFWEHTRSELTPPASNAPRRKWFLERISPLDASQKAAIRRFIELSTQGPERSRYPREDRAIFFWQRIAALDRAEHEDAGEQDSTLLKLRKVLLGENPLSEPETREVKALEQEIAREVEEAFANASPPEDNGTPESLARWKDVPEDFRGKHWRDISPNVLSKYGHEIKWFSAEAFRFFLPAYLIAALLHAEETDELRDQLFYHLLFPPDEFRSIELFMERNKLLNSAQRKVVLRFMELWAKTAIMYPDAIKERGIAFWRRVTSIPSTT